MATIYHGADVSTYQGTINWATYAANKDFVIIKAGGCDAGYYQDSKFSANQTGARAQTGLRIGYYFFGDINEDPYTSANYFIGIVGALNNGEILVLDIEGANAPDDTWAYQFSDTLKTYYGFDPFCYMSQYIYSSSLPFTTTTPITHLWMANWSLSATDFSQTAGVAEWGQSYSNYNILQYADNGTVSGISGAVDLDSFYSPNSTLADWDALGFQGGSIPTHGIWTQNAQFNVTPTFTQPLQETISVPQNNYDKVIFSTTWSDSVTASSWPQTRTGPTNNTNQTCYPVGNYMYTLNGSGNGAWNDFSFIYSASDIGTYIGDLPPVVIQPIVSNTGALSFVVDVPVGSGSQTVNYTVNITLLLSYKPSAMLLPSVAQSTAYANLVPNITPAYAAYRRIATDALVSGTGAHTIAHHQSGIPNVIAFPQDSGGDTFINPTAWTNTGAVSTAFGLAMDSTNLYFNIDTNLTGACYRVYSDN